MIDLYYWTTPNGHKITMFLEEASLPYALKPIRIGRGEQFSPEFLSISPNNRIPAIVDHAPASGGEPLSLFESGAILLYLGNKTGELMPQDPREHAAALCWLFWQMGGLGPMLGQNHHFLQYAPEKIAYAIDRYTDEAKRLYRVLDNRLADVEYLAGPYSIADIAAYPWTVGHERQGIDLVDYPHVKRWRQAIMDRPATKRAYAVADTISTDATVDEESRKFLFGQQAPTAPQPRGG